jgi:hypothetical protein
MTTVYRIQDVEGRGPWKPGFSHKWAADRSPKDYARLMFSEKQFGALQRLGIYGMARGFGCISLDDLRLWFIPEEYKTLVGFGYSAVKIHDADVLASLKVQCFFQRALPLRIGAEIFDLYPQPLTHENLPAPAAPSPPVNQGVV